MDRGFDAMIPRSSNEVDKSKEDDYSYDIEFNLFGKRFSFSLKVKDRSEL